MKQQMLLAVALASVLSMIASLPTLSFASSNGEENRNGDDNGVEADSVQVEVQRGENDTEEYNVTPNITVVVGFEDTLVTNESITVGEPAPTPEQSNQTAPEPERPAENQTQQNQTTPPEPERPAENQTAPEQPQSNQTQGNQTTEPPVVIPPAINQTSNETAPSQGNETAPPIEVIDENNETQTVPPSEVIIVDENTTETGNETAPPIEPADPNGNDTAPVVTEPIEEPTNEATAINLALIDTIQRGHKQHVTAFVTDDSGNEFQDEKVSIEVVNAKGKLLREFSTTSGQDVTFKVGPNTAPQTIEVKATLESNPEIMTTADYYVYPKGQAPTEAPPLTLPPQPEPFPTVNQTQGSNETNVETPTDIFIPNATLN